ncbi:mitochondrial ribosomal small subunit component [Scheffersomyces spartinae]|uniref:Small ribosomal subunit protein bS6m n=1 Tax=Scheffersomyces spartinae TaxID=45513 RepID=A0A9P8AKG3_9ASCO|nr:mitochondrial ribosomal small subunit component [Scheffersomyces spartinae]KAG7195856.1 mitochondrial ribosomal small subunit component [Scheffersomyces spartinae]
MYYELVAIARIADPLKSNFEAVKIALTVGRLILNNRGIIRDITSLGPRPLHKIISKEQERHYQGFHFMMGFDSSLTVQQELLRTLRRDPRILRCSIIKRDITEKLSPGTSFEQALNSLPKES